MSALPSRESSQATHTSSPFSLTAIFGRAEYADPSVSESARTGSLNEPPASAELTTPEGLYALQDLVVANCGGHGGGAGGGALDQVTLNYSKVQVRGWNPEKKEE